MAVEVLQEVLVGLVRKVDPEGIREVEEQTEDLIVGKASQERAATIGTEASALMEEEESEVKVDHSVVDENGRYGPLTLKIVCQTI